MALFEWLNDFRESANNKLGYSDKDAIIDYSKLGQFEDRIDKSAIRSYVETGTIRNIKPSFAEILLQQPDVTIVVKKKMFSSLVDNYRPELMDSADRNFFKASKRLFQNKCNLLATYERLSKIDKIAQNKGILDDYLLPIVTSGLDVLSSFIPSIVSSKTKAVLDTMKKLNYYSEQSNFMNWIIDPTHPNVYGEGTGVFDLTLVSSFTTSSTVNFGQGKSNFNIENPYGLFSVKEEDIEQAISDTYSAFTGQSLIFQFSQNELNQLNEQLKYELNSNRAYRGASLITVSISEDSVLNKKVRVFDDSGREIFFNYDAGLFGVGDSVDIDPSAEDGKNGLNNDDKELLSRILKNTYQLINSKRQQDTSKYNSDSEEVNYVREKMNLFFKNKNIIQVMDEIHVYISSKTKYDDNVRGINVNSNYGTSNNILNLMNTTSQNLELGLSDLKTFFGGRQNEFAEIEKNAIVGPDFPTWLWTITRNSFTRQAAGVHVFGGIVSDVSESYNGGKYNLSISVDDNCAYLRQGQINVKPAADVVDREIYDPLTPFDLTFDPSTGFISDSVPKLLPENMKLLESGLVKFKNGSRFLGSAISPFTYGIGDINRKGNGSRNIQRVFFDPDGFVYRWKSGIGTFTYQGPRHPRNPIREDTSPRMTDKIFGGQDVMNVLSLLITGVPYNFNTFIKSAVNLGNLSFSSNGAVNYNNVEVARSFYRSFVSDLRINNSIWGNFIPFKKLDVTDKGLGFLLQNQYSIQKSQGNLQQLLDRRAKFVDLLISKDISYANDPRIWSSDTSNLGLTSDTLESDSQYLRSIAELNLQIAQQQQDMMRTIDNINSSSAENGTVKIYGNDFSLDSTLSDSGNNQGDEDRQKMLFRKKLKYLTQRRLWKVKANEDMNLLIIDDQYDKDYDIQAFEQKINGRMDTIKSEYADTFNQISQVSSLLGLEVFADTQGHIQIKPPGYNKIPSSVFYKLIRSKKRLFPKQLESMFINQSNSLIDRLEIIEDEIRLRACALGYSKDIDAEKFLSSASSTLHGGYFVFITDESDNAGSEKRPSTIKRLISQNNAEDHFDLEKLPLKKFENAVNGQLRQQELFTYSSHVSIAFNKEVLTINSSSDERYEELRDRLSRKKGIKSPSKNELFSNARNLGGRVSQTDILKLTKEISVFVQERQNLIKTLSNSIKNVQASYSINTDVTTPTSLLFPSLDNKTAIPEIIAHMIEDEEEDDLGPGSGSRYIIKDAQIISLTISENPPEFTTIEINGLFGEGIANGPDFSFSNGGNAIVTAIGVDYDLWKQYGFKVAQGIPAPFISDSETQAAPLAVWQLTRQRRNIIKGNCTITGNEYMQPGEVVYIESKDLLFYVETVNHSFDYSSGNFTTTLTLTFGHNPGEYFPTMLDIIGKGLYASGFKSNISNVRTGNASGDEPLGVVIIDPTPTEMFFSSNDVEKIVKGKFGEYNRRTLSNIIISTKGSQAQNTSVQPVIEARIYYNSKKGFPADPYLLNCANGIKDWLKNPTHGILTSGETLLPDNTNESMKIDDIDNIFRITTVDYEDPQSPSTQAIAGARDAIGQNPAAFDFIQNVIPEEKALYSGIIDIWIKFETKPKVLEITTSDIITQSNRTDPLQAQTEADIDRQKEQEKTRYLQSQQPDLFPGT